MKNIPVSLVRAVSAVLFGAPMLFAFVPAARAVAALPPGDPIWLADPATNDWNTGSNWQSGTAPNGSNAPAIFQTSSKTTVTLSDSTQVSQITFSAGGSAFTIDTAGNSFEFDGNGVINNSGKVQTILNSGNFSQVGFYGPSSAGNIVIINAGEVSSTYFGEDIEDTPTAANSTIINSGAGSFVSLANNASGGKATIINVAPDSYIDISGLSGAGTTLGAIAGKGTVYLGSKNLAVGGNNVSTTFSGVITDGAPEILRFAFFKEFAEEIPKTGGSLTKVGTGTLNLTGANTYTGNTIVDGGTLLVNGSIVSPLTTVNAGGTLGGSGVVGGAVINNGLVSPGNSPGTFRVQGNYTQGSQGGLLIQIASQSVFDRLEVSGSAKIGGTVIVSTLDGLKLKRGDEFQFLLAAGGVSGNFSDIVEPDTGTVLQFRLVYRDGSVVLLAEPGSFILPGLTPNQQAVAHELNRVVNDRRADKLINYLSERPLEKLPNDFDKIAPEELTSIFTIGTALANVQSLNLQRRTDDLRHGATGFSAAGLAMQGVGPGYNGSLWGAAGPTGKETKDVKAVTPEEQRWGVFLTGVGEWVGVGDDFNARGYDIATGGFTLGVDYKVTPNFAVGVSAGYAGTGVDLTDHGRVWVNGGKLGLYATYFQTEQVVQASTMSKDSSKEAPVAGPAVAKGFYVDLAATGGYNSYDTRRAGLRGDARGDTDGGELNVLVGTGYDFKVGALTFGPTATFNYTNVGIDGFTERGSLAPLDIHGQNQESIRSAVGVKASYDWRVGGLVIRPELRAAWQHEYGDRVYTLDSSFASGAGNAFEVSGPVTGRDSLLIGAGFAIQCSERCSTYLYYDGELGRTNFDSHNVSGGLRIAF